jgi:hypothetical protein
MVTRDKKVKTLGQFADRVGHLRKLWGTPDHKELWFRGEGKAFKPRLRPKLYRPAREGNSIKRIGALIRIENELYETFQHGAVQLSDERTEDDNWDWDSYFLMQHHLAPTRLLDWSDGALIALHFAVRDKEDDPSGALVYVLEPDRLKARLESLPDEKATRKAWKRYVKKHPSYDFGDDEWERAYLPADNHERKEVPLPGAPLLLEFPHITRRVAAQRSRFMVFGTDQEWLANEFRRTDCPLKAITIDAASKHAIRMELRDSGVTESVIFPDLDGLGREMSQLWKDRN